MGKIINSLICFDCLIMEGMDCQDEDEEGGLILYKYICKIAQDTVAYIDDRGMLFFTDFGMKIYTLKFCPFFIGEIQKST